MLRIHAAIVLFAAPLLLPAMKGAPPEWPGRYALILDGAPLANQATREALHAPIAEGRRKELLSAQRSLQLMLAMRHIAVTGSVHTLLNAVFVAASADRVPQLRALPGVAAVIPMPVLHRKLNKALNLVNATQAWAALEGASNAGAGVKIGILDTGIDQTHPGFQDPSLAMPSGYPKTDNTEDATYATNKIIAVRSFVSSLAMGDGTPETSSPDDLSARDRVGHGTAMAMIAAGTSHQSPLGTISGIAPKAWLGSYKIFGSPGINDATTADVVLQALDAAFNDGMDVALLSAGDLPVLWSSADRGSACGETSGTVCDPWAAAVSAAASGGMTIVTPAGNDGALGASTINTPGDAASVITVGASSNVHVLASTVFTPGGDSFAMRQGDGPKLIGDLSAPLVDVAAIDNTGLGCTALPAASLHGAIALVSHGLPALRGNCSFATTVNNVSSAGAVAVLIFLQPGASVLFELTGLSNTGIPTALISYDAGTFLAAYLASHPGTFLTLVPVVSEASSSLPPAVASFSSRGPGIGDASIKPELVAPGAGIYTAAQNFDPNGDLYSPDRYIGADGTSFAAALVAGAAALVKQAHPSYTAAQVKSAITNTASTGLVDYEVNGAPFPARVEAAGAGQLNAQAAVTSTITIDPATVAFGIVNAGPPSSALPSKTVVITNTGTAAASLRLAVSQRDADANASIILSPASLNLAPGQSGSITVALVGGTPRVGSYEGSITVAGGAVPLQIPYLYIASDNLPSNQIPLVGSNFVTELGTSVNLTFRTVDLYGVPVAGVAVDFAPSALVYAATSVTDSLGTAEAYMTTPSTTRGDQSFFAQLEGSGEIEFDGRTRALPQIADGGVLDAASLNAPAGFVAGSYLTIFGSGLSENFEKVNTPYLPLSLAGVSVSFDVPATGISVPGPLYFVSGGQMTVQIPWELAGSGSAEMKVTLSNSASRNVRSDDSKLSTNHTQIVTVPIAAYSPAFFEILETSSGEMLAAASDEHDNVITSMNPAQRGQPIQFFVNGLGAVSGSQPPSGMLTPASPLAFTAIAPTVTIGGQQATVLFSGLAPLTVGLYQVNVTVPQGASSGLQNAVISIGGATSKAAQVPVQ
jgi:uncharacterized protein (TIGR03437 family)